MVGKTPSRRYRKHNWIDTDKLKPLYGIQASVTKRTWLHVAVNGVPLLYDSAIERDTALKALRDGARA